MYWFGGSVKNRTWCTLCGFEGRSSVRDFFDNTTASRTPRRACQGMYEGNCFLILEIGVLIMIYVYVDLYYLNW